MQASHESGTQHIEILPLKIVTQEFSARPSSLPEVRDFVRRQLTATPLSDQEVRTLCDRVADVLFEAAGESGAIQVSLRMFPTWAEVDVLHSSGRELSRNQATVPRARENGTKIAEGLGAGVRPDHGSRADPDQPETAGSGSSSRAPSFADWLAAGLRREGLTMDAAARRLNVSAKTIGRWVGGTTEPRLRDLYRIREVFGEPPFR
jgi:hypothetical protein